MTASAVSSRHADTVRARVDGMLERLVAALPETEVVRASRYLILAGGQRWRGLLAVAAGRIYEPEPERFVLPLACAVEILHAASLVLDDLPSMDNAQTRRGKPCMHRVFPPWVVDMVPAFLVNLAYQVCADNPAPSSERCIQAIRLLGEMSACLARGQELDLALNTRTVPEPELLECYAHKSGALFAAALAGGGILCGAGPADTDALRAAGLRLGQAYQILDDLSELSDPANPGGQDAGKCTAVTLLGAEGARARADQLFTEADRGLDRFGPAAGLLHELLAQVRAILDKSAGPIRAIPGRR